MKTRCLLLVAGLVALSMGMADSLAFADSEARPTSYTQVTPGEKYVFVMLTRETDSKVGRAWSEADKSRDEEIRRTYKQNGLYRNDGSAEPLWTVDWYAGGVEVASDGIHLIRGGPWALAPEDHNVPLGKADFDQEAVSFFANGRLLRKYTIAELITNPARLYRSWSHFEWRVEAGQFDDERMEYRLSTKDGNRLVFDVRTGEIISDSRVRADQGAGAGGPELEIRPADPAGATSVGRAILWAAGIVLGVFVIALSVWLVVRDWLVRSQTPKD